MNIRSVPALCSVVLIVLSGCSGGQAPGAPVPTVSVDAGASSVVEGTALQFTVRAVPAPAVDLPVTVNLVETGAVLAGPLSRAVTIRAGSDAALLTVDTIDDEQDEPASTVTVALAGGTGYALGAAALASVVVTDNDEPEPPVVSTPVVTIAAVAARVSEGVAAEFTLHAQPAPAADLVVNVAVAESGAMLAAAPPRMATIAAGTAAVTLTLPTVDDLEDEPAGTVTATVTAGTGYTLGGETSASVTVADDDEPAVPEITIAAAASSVTEGMATVFTLSADPEPSAESCR